MKFKIDMKMSLKIFFYTIIIGLIISLLFCISLNFPIYFKLFLIIFIFFYIAIFFSVINAHVIINPDSIKINGGIFTNKKISINNVICAFVVSPDVSISRDNPVYSNNIVGINYLNNGACKTIYISVKQTDSFINYIDTQLHSL